MQSDQSILSKYLLDAYILFCGKGTFEQWTDMSLPCSNLCHRIHFHSNIIIIPTIKFVKTMRIQFVETQAFYKNFTTTSILLHFNMSFEFDYFLHIQPSCIHFGQRCKKQNAKRPECFTHNPFISGVKKTYRKGLGACLGR